MKEENENERAGQKTNVLFSLTKWEVLSRSNFDFFHLENLRLILAVCVRVDAVGLCTNAKLLNFMIVGISSPYVSFVDDNTERKEGRGWKGN